MSRAIPETLRNYAEAHEILGLTAPSLESIQGKKKGYTLERAKAFMTFQKRINKELLKHKVITNNEFTAWFEKGEMSYAQAKAFIVQFSVFSNLFLFAQLHKTINADSLEGMRASKEILVNELGVIFNAGARTSLSKVKDKDREGDPDLVNTEGTVEGGKYRFRAAHFEWLLNIAQYFDLTFTDIGKRRLGTKSTLFFCDELYRLYGGDNYQISQSASYAVENWAAAGFWKQLIQGLAKFKEREKMNCPLAFFTWHDRVESQHALHTQEELEEYFFEHSVNEDDFIKYGNEMMEAIWVFWDGLNQQRKKI